MNEETELDWQHESGGRKSGGEGEKRKCLKMRLSHWLEMSDRKKDWKMSWILQCGNKHRH